MDNLKNLYDKLYDNGYHSDLNTSHTTNLINNGVKKFIPTGKILDVGCSNGAALIYLNKLGYEAYGTDISEVAIDNCRVNGLKNVTCSPSHIIPFIEKFNGITCTDVLEHVKETDIIPTINAFKESIHKDGYIFLKISVCIEKNRAWDKITNEFGLDNLHIYVKDSKFWINLFNTHDLNVVEVLNDNINFLEIILKNKK